MGQKREIAEINKFNRLYLWLTTGMSEDLSLVSKRFDLTYSQYVLLMLINDSKEVTVSDLAKKVRVSKAAISRQCGNLFKLGYLEKNQTVTEDRRIRVLTTSTAGATALTNLQHDYIQLYETVQKNVPQTALVDAGETLNLFKESITEFNQSDTEHA